jgi:hypothetical protein
MGIAWHHDAFVPLGECHQRLLEPSEVFLQMLKGISKVESKIKSNLVIAASARVKLPTKWPNELGKTSLYAHMHIFVFYLPSMSANSNVFSNLVQSLDNSVAFACG